MNKQIEELKPEQTEDVMGGVIAAMAATYSTSATMIGQRGAAAQGLGWPGATVLRR
jgi:hypothetical protein